MSPAHGGLHTFLFDRICQSYSNTGKNLLNRDDMDFVFLCSIPSVIIELGAEDFMLRDVNSFRVFHRPEGLFLFSFIRFS